MSCVSLRRMHTKAAAASCLSVSLVRFCRRHYSVHSNVQLTAAVDMRCLAIEPGSNTFAQIRSSSFGVCRKFQQFNVGKEYRLPRRKICEPFLHFPLAQVKSAAFCPPTGKVCFVCSRFASALSPAADRIRSRLKTLSFRELFRSHRLPPSCIVEYSPG